MKLMVMKRSGRRLLLPDRRAALFRKMRIAYEDLQPVVKLPVVEAMSAEPEREMEPHKPRGRRRYKRRDMDAEETCFEESNEYSNYSA